MPTTLSLAPDYGPIGFDPHGLALTANEKTAYITARGVADEIKVLNLNGADVSTIVIDPRPGIARIAREVPGWIYPSESGSAYVFARSTVARNIHRVPLT